jgi:hypothetical protein
MAFMVSLQLLEQVVGELEPQLSKDHARQIHGLLNQSDILAAVILAVGFATNEGVPLSANTIAAIRAEDWGNANLIRRFWATFEKAIAFSESRELLAA